MRELQRYPWPGNVRELRNVIERAVILATGPQLTVAVPASRAPIATPSSRRRSPSFEVEHIRADARTAPTGAIRGAGGAAERLGLKPTTLESRPEHQCPSFLEYGEYPYVIGCRDQEGARPEALLLGHARPDAVEGRACRTCSTSTRFSTCC